jgi:hypothetical protein
MMCVGIFIFGTILMAITSGVWLTNGEVNIINGLATFEVKQFGDFVNPNIYRTWFDALVRALSWDYPGTWLDATLNGWVFFVKIPLYLCSLGVLWMLFEAAKGLIQGAAGVLRSILG